MKNGTAFLLASVAGTAHAGAQLWQTQCDQLRFDKVAHFDRFNVACGNNMALSSFEFGQLGCEYPTMRANLVCDDSIENNDHERARSTQCGGDSYDFLRTLYNHDVTCQDTGFLQRFQFYRDRTTDVPTFQGCVNSAHLGTEGTLLSTGTSFVGCARAARANGHSQFRIVSPQGGDVNTCYSSNSFTYGINSLVPNSECESETFNGGADLFPLGSSTASAIYTLNDGCFDGMRASYECAMGTPNNCSTAYTPCDLFTEADSQYIDRHPVECPAGKFLTSFHAEQCEGNDGLLGRIKFTCCDQASNISGLQKELDNYCQTMSVSAEKQDAYGYSEFKYARRDTGTENQRTPLWRCYTPDQLDFDTVGVNNCVDNCGSITSCAGAKVNEVSQSHASRNSQISAIIIDRAATFCNSQSPTAYPTRQPTDQPTDHPTHAAGTDDREIQIAAHAVGLECNDISINVHHFWKKVNEKAHVDDPGDGVFRFSLKGGAAASVNVALVDSSVAVDDESFDGVDIFIGADDEPIVHISDGLDSVPLAFIDISDNKVFAADTFTNAYIKVDSDAGSIEVGKGTYGADDAVVLLTHVFTPAKTINKAVFSYGYGDYECEQLA